MFGVKLTALPLTALDLRALAEPGLGPKSFRGGSDLGSRTNDSAPCAAKLPISSFDHVRGVR